MASIWVSSMRFDGCERDFNNDLGRGLAESDNRGRCFSGDIQAKQSFLLRTANLRLGWCVSVAAKAPPTKLMMDAVHRQILSNWFPYSIEKVWKEA